MGNSIYLRQLILRRTLLDPDVFPSLFVSLHIGDPGDMGEDEVIGNAYRRQRLSLVEITAGVTTNGEIIEFNGLPKATVTHFGIFDDLEAGIFLTGGSLLIAQSVVQDQILRWREGELVLRVG